MQRILPRVARAHYARRVSRLRQKKKGKGQGWVRLGVEVRRVSFIMRGTRRYDNQSLL